MNQEVGVVEERRNSTSYFQWSIPNFFSTVDNVFSPQFKCGNAFWKFCIEPNSFGSILLSASPNQTPNRSDRVVSCITGITDKDGHTYVLEKHIDYGWFITRNNLIARRSVLVPNNVLTVSCTFIFDRSIGKGRHSANEKGIDKMMQDFKYLFLNEQDCDVTLEVKDQVFQAHISILKARSPFFKSMFRHDMVENSSGVVNIPDCNPDVFKQFLIYLYSGRTEEMNISNVVNLFTIADKYLVDDLKKICIEYIKEEMSVDNFGNVMALTVRHSELSLIQSTAAFFARNMKEIIRTVNWQTFIVGNPMAANELLIKAPNIR